MEWDSPPDAFKKAGIATAIKRYEDAAQLYLTAAKEAKREVIQLEARFLAGRAYLKAAGTNKTKAEAAGQAVEDYVNAAPDGFHVPEARLILGKVKIITGDAAAAEQLMVAVETDANKGGWPDFWVAQGERRTQQGMDGLPGAVEHRPGRELEEKRRLQRCVLSIPSSPS